LFCGDFRQRCHVRGPGQCSLVDPQGVTAGGKSVSKLAAFPRKAEIPDRGDAMISYGGKELADAFRTVRKNTIQIAEAQIVSWHDADPRPTGRNIMGFHDTMKGYDFDQ
jgi:hypothetical protein